MLDIRNHPQLKELKTQILGYAKEEDYTFIQVSGVPVEYRSEIISLIEDYSFVYSNILSNQIRNLTQTLVVLDIKQINYSILINELSELSFEHVQFVSKPSEYSIKGDIVIFWPSLYKHPVRAEFFGDDLENIEIFDITVNLRIGQVHQIVLINESLQEAEPVFFELSDPLKSKFSKVIICFDQYGIDLDINFDFKQPRLFFQRLDLLKDYISTKSEEKFRIIINTRHEEDLPEELKKYVDNSVHFPSGIVSNLLKTIVFTDREIFGTIFLQSEVAKNIATSESRKILAEFEGEVEIGDYVVHEDHGIGQYVGITQEKASDDHVHETNYIQIKYAEGDELLVPLNLVYKITKFIGADGEKPKLTTLGKMQWKTMTAKARAAIQIMASELVRHYAKISVAQIETVNKGDSEDYNKFVEEFEHEETPDQMRSISEINIDLMGNKPMNRLLIGDVGFGKTEVIMRAAFKLVEAGKQVAILCPTTVLTSQHFKSFSKRFAHFGFKIGFLSRFNDKYVNKDVIAKVVNGEIDIIIGTHRLLSNDLEFKNLGMIVIDEEQKFGVKQKEKLKKYQYGVHVLSTTATPIPRTLSMALSTIQTISTIHTPPKGRKPVKIKVGKMDWNQIVEAVKFELSRGGQIYIIYNSIKSISSIAVQLKRFIPEIKLEIAHGQMSGDKLEKIMINFLDRKFDCLLCTTIVENGIDIKNVNTLIVIKAQNYGLSQLYQLRGRVGRSDREAYAYFFYDGEDLEKMESEDNTEEKKKRVKTKNYLKRLKALAEATELGAGFEIATKDLEIRGAGNLLGQQQHGHINQIGFGLYMQMLAQEIERLKNETNNK